MLTIYMLSVIGIWFLLKNEHRQAEFEILYCKSEFRIGGPNIDSEMYSITY